MTDTEQYIKEIDESIVELNTLPGKVAKPKDEVKFIGTVLVSTICFLSSAANSLDNGCRVKKFKRLDNWGEVLKSVNRSFYSSVVTSTELGLELYIKKKGKEVKSSLKNRFDKEYNELRDLIKEEATKVKFENFYKEITENKRPIFADYLNVALKLSTFDNKGKKSIKRFFKALTIVRNKASHSNTTLTEQEKGKLVDGGFKTFISEDGSLQATPKDYYSVSKHIIDFFEKLN